MNRERADVLLVTRGLAPSRERARALILAGKVFTGETRIEKAGSVVSVDADIDVRGDDNPYVSRGGIKLAGALDAFNLDPRDFVVADFGASTGGFTDCVLQRGTARVYAIDVGYGQLHEKLRRDARVVVMERTNARHLKQGSLREAVDLVVIDASFIGIGKLLPAANALLKSDGTIVAMVKPQFEVGKALVGKRGVVRDEAVRIASIKDVIAEASSLGLICKGQVDSTIRGPEGNLETFLWLCKG